MTARSSSRSACRLGSISEERTTIGPAPLPETAPPPEARFMMLCKRSVNAGPPPAPLMAGGAGRFCAGGCKAPRVPGPVCPFTTPAPPPPAGAGAGAGSSCARTTVLARGNRAANAVTVIDIKSPPSLRGILSLTPRCNGVLISSVEGELCSVMTLLGWIVFMVIGELNKFLLGVNGNGIELFLERQVQALHVLGAVSLINGVVSGQQLFRLLTRRCQQG